MAKNSAKSIKDNLEAIDRLRNRRKELLIQLNHEGLLEEAELNLAKELSLVCSAIKKLNDDRLELLEQP